MVGMGNERDVDIAYIGETKDIAGMQNPDDAVVVQIDTGERTKRLRIMLNEHVLYDGDPEIQHIDPVTIFRHLEHFEAVAHQLSLDIGALRGGLAAQIERSPGIKL